MALDPDLIQNTSDPEEFLSSNIEDYLLSLADSLQLVQRELNQQTIGQDGAPSIRYQLPRLEFELKMSIELAKSSRSGTRGALLAKPVSVFSNSSNSSAAEAATVIKGSFVAVPVDGGKPPAIVNTSIHRVKEASRKWEIRVDVQSAVGQKLQGIEVHYNIDRDASRSLSEADSLFTELSPQTFVRDGVLITDQNGQAYFTDDNGDQRPNYLEASPAELPGTYIVVLVDVLGRSERLVFQVDDNISEVTPDEDKLISFLLNDWIPTEEQLLDMFTVDDLRQSFPVNLPTEFERLVSEQPELLQGANMVEAFGQKFEELQNRMESIIITELNNWIAPITKHYDTEEDMRLELMDAAQEPFTIALLRRPPELWERARAAQSLTLKFNNHGRDRINIVLTAFNSWVPSNALLFFTDETAMRTSFSGDQVAGSDEAEIASQEVIWQEQLLSDALRSRFEQWKDDYEAALKADIIRRINIWTVTPNQQARATSVGLLRDEFFTTRASLRQQVDELLATHGRNLDVDADILQAFTDKFDSLN